MASSPLVRCSTTVVATDAGDDFDTINAHLHSIVTDTGTGVGAATMKRALASTIRSGTIVREFSKRMSRLVNNI
jgi:hypothetical protein